MDNLIPTIFIPGITGNTIVNSNTIDFQLMYSAVSRYFKNMEPLSLTVDERFEASASVIAERANVEHMAYVDLPNFINADNGFQLFIFNYDWRKSNGTSGKRLVEYVNYLKEKLGKRKFNFVTHSMGALVFRAFLKQLDPADYDVVSQVTLTVPPNKGAVEALKMLVIGKSYLINSKDSFRKLARTFPSLYEMVPIYPDAYDATEVPNFDIFNPDFWQSNLYKEEDAISKEMLQTRLKNAKEFVTNGMVELSQLPEDLRKRIVIIAGNKEATYDLVKIHAQNTEGRAVSNYFDFETPSHKNGDGTVPAASALCYKDSIQTIQVDNSIWHGNPLDIIVGQHALFLTDGRVEQLIKRYLSTPQGEWWKVIGGSVNLA